MASCTSPRVSASTLPISRVMSRAIFSLFWRRMLAVREKDLGPLGRGNQPPGGEGLLSGGDGQGHVFSVGGRKRADDVRVVGRVEVEDGFAVRGRKPLAADQVVVGGIGHESLVRGERWTATRKAYHHPQSRPIGNSPENSIILIVVREPAAGVTIHWTGWVFQCLSLRSHCRDPRHGGDRTRVGAVDGCGFARLNRRDGRAHNYWFRVMRITW